MSSHLAETGDDMTIDPFDPAALRLNPSFADSIGVKKLLTTIPVRRRF